LEVGSRRGPEEGAGQGMMEKGAGNEVIDHNKIIAQMFYLSKVFTLNFSSRGWGFYSTDVREGQYFGNILLSVVYEGFAY